jgi:energy-coupling factor transporter ATP-binding protein EcfA2
MAEHRLDTILPYADRHISLSNGNCKEHKRDGSFCVGHDGGERKDERKKNRPFATPLLSAQKEPSLLCNSPALEGDVILEAKHLSYGVGGREILRDISFSVRRGERLAILGENGCGKTTLLRVLARLAKPTGGVAEQHIDPVLGQKASPRWFKRVGYVYQNPNYQLFMPTVLDEIAYQAESISEAKRFAEMFGLSELLERHPHSLSEGQKRKLGIAAVCATRPDVLLLDEPTVGQDHASLEQMAGVLDTMNREYGATIVIVTHDRRFATTLADRELHMDPGRIRTIERVTTASG